MEDVTGTEEHSRTAVPDQTALVETFVALADTLVDDFDAVEFLSMLTRRVVELSIATEAGILLADEAGDLQVMAASQERTRLLELFQIQNDEGPCRECFLSGHPVAVPDLELERDRWPQFAPRAVAVGFRSIQAVPLRLRGEVLGAMNLFIAQPGGVDATALSLVQAMADIATISLLQRRTTLNAQLHLGQIQHALQSRIVIEQAKGIVAQQADISVDEAFERLRAYSRNHNRRVHDLALAVIDGDVTATSLAPNATLP